MLVSFKEMLEDAFARKYAVGAFNCLSLENVLGAIQAAEELRSPLILQLAEVQFPYSPLEMMAPIFLKAAEQSTMPVTVHLDHALSYDTCAKAIKHGFRSVMIDGSVLPFNENRNLTREVVKMAKAFGVNVEAELGKVGDTGEGISETGYTITDTSDVFTDVDESERFIQETGIDALAIAIGNMHGKYTATPRLNIERVKEINQRNNLPLVLHGGTGTSDDDFRACIQNGITKINVATAMQIAVTEKINHYLTSTPKPNYIEMKYKMVEASKETVMRHLLLFGSNNRL